MIIRKLGDEFTKHHFRSTYLTVYCVPGLVLAAETKKTDFVFKLITVRWGADAELIKWGKFSVFTGCYESPEEGQLTVGMLWEASYKADT